MGQLRDNIWSHITKKYEVIVEKHGEIAKKIGKFSKLLNREVFHEFSNLQISNQSRYLF